MGAQPRFHLQAFFINFANWRSYNSVRVKVYTEFFDCSCGLLGLCRSTEAGLFVGGGVRWGSDQAAFSKGWVTKQKSNFFRNSAKSIARSGSPYPSDIIREPRYFGKRAKQNRMCSEDQKIKTNSKLFMWIFWWIEINIPLKALHDMELCGRSLRQNKTC